nr:MAG TPA: hypothetical protein [Caudoviricetes sp.]
MDQFYRDVYQKGLLSGQIFKACVSNKFDIILFIKNLLIFS